MTPEKTKLLYKHHPRLYAERRLSTNHSCMSYGFMCEDGWYNIIKKLSLQLSEYSKRFHLSLRVTQVKEKFGGLRFYVNHTDDYINRRISEAMSISFNTCEVCGSNDRVKLCGRSYVQSLCFKHSKSKKPICLGNLYDSPSF